MVKRAGPKGLSKRDLGNNIRLKKRDRTEYIDTLITDGRIIPVITNVGKPGPEGLNYIADCYADNPKSSDNTSKNC